MSRFLTLSNAKNNALSAREHRPYAELWWLQLTKSTQPIRLRSQSSSQEIRRTLRHFKASAFQFIKSSSKDLEA